MSNDAEQRHTAIQEAGHAVADVRLGIQQERATIAPGAGTLGVSTAEGVEHVWSKEDAAPMAIAYAAGYAALRAAGYAEADASKGASNDFERIERMVEQWGIDAVPVWQARAINLMSEPRNVAAVDLVARYLLAETTLPGDDISLLVALADGHVTPGGFARYRALKRQAVSRTGNRRLKPRAPSK